VTLRRSAGWVCLAVLVVIACGCSSPSSAPAAAHRPPRTTGETSTSAATPTTAAPSAVPTTVPIPPRPVPGWSAALTTLPPGGGFTSLSCISDTFCIAVGGGTSGDPSELTAGSGVAESWDGASWSDPSVYYPDPANGPVTAPVLPAVSCTSGPSCVIADGSGHVSTGDGTTWSAPAPMPAAPSMPANPGDPGPGHPGSRSAAVSCPSPAFCAFVGNTGAALAFGGGSWHPPQSFGAGSGTPTALYQSGRVGVSCPTSSSCTAVVGASVLGWDGSTWSQQPSPWTTSLAPGSSDPTDISCPSASVCFIVNGTGVSTGSMGSPWSGEESVDPNGHLDSISCPSTTFCLASDAGGSVIMWNGTTWSGPNQVIPTATEYPGIGTTVSCPSPEFCMVINSDGDYATYSGAPAP